VRTPSQTVGPFYSIGLCRSPGNELVPDGVVLAGTLFDGRGEPIPDGLVEVWDGERRLWGRCGTEPDGDFSFRVPVETDRLEVHVFARGLLRHQWTRAYLREDAADELLSSLQPAERETLVARREAGGMRFDIRMQGDNATVFFAH
jgi:protocatechuate 3,4-dioxygenase alpha subunit